MRTCIRLAAFSLILGLLVGCGSTQQVRHNSPQQALQRGMEQYEEGDYERAIRYFQGVISYGRDTEYADEAQFYLARAHREQGSYLMAATEFKRFVDLYRGNPRVPQAEYQRALAYYELSPDYQLDQTNTRRAVQYFQLFIERNPNHELVSDAQNKIEELRAKLGHKKFEAGQLYEQRGLYRAAAHAYVSTFDQYPDTPWADDALLGAIRAYIEYSDRSVEGKQDDRLQQAIDYYNRLVQVFPNSPLLKQAETQYERARERLDRLNAQDDRSLAEGEDGSATSGTE
jgi:outer membrane protein assembly factor BamD